MSTCLCPHWARRTIMSVWFPVAGSQFTPEGLPPAEIWDHSGQCNKADSRFAPSRWETAFLCNNVSHWLGASLESSLCNGYSLIVSVDADTIRTKTESIKLHFNIKIAFPDIGIAIMKYKMAVSLWGTLCSEIKMLINQNNKIIQYFWPWPCAVICTCFLYTPISWLPVRWAIWLPQWSPASCLCFTLLLWSTL